MLKRVKDLQGIIAKLMPSVKSANFELTHFRSFQFSKVLFNAHLHFDCFFIVFII